MRLKTHTFLLPFASVCLLLAGGYALWLSGRTTLVGVNLPSATFAARSLPGQPGVDYFYPDERDIDYFLGQGMNAIRLGFIWERLQPDLNGPLDRDELRRLDDAVRAITSRGATAILDLHNYAQYRQQVLGSAGVPEESLADLWGRLAELYGGDDRVMFGLMNEPHDISAEQWRNAAELAIVRIRETGARNLILVSSSEWSGAARFAADGDIWKRIVDPADKLAFEVHQYVDVDSSGTHAECPDASAGAAAIDSVTRWLDDNRKKAFLGEFGGSGRGDCLAALSQMLERIKSRPDVWLGWTYFAGGRGWSEDDMLSIQPTSDAEKPQMAVLKTFVH